MLLRIEALLQQGAAPAPTGLVATAKGNQIHRAGCEAVAAARHDLRAVAPQEPGPTPCLICDPLGDDILDG